MLGGIVRRCAFILLFVFSTAFLAVVLVLVVSYMVYVNWGAVPWGVPIQIEIHQGEVRTGIGRYQVIGLRLADIAFMFALCTAVIAVVLVKTRKRRGFVVEPKAGRSEE